MERSLRVTATILSSWVEALAPDRVKAEAAVLPLFTVVQTRIQTPPGGECRAERSPGEKLDSVQTPELHTGRPSPPPLQVLSILYTDSPTLLRFWARASRLQCL